MALAQAEPDVYAAVGIHPHDAATADDAALARIAELARAPKVVAIGELGLDYYRDLSPRDAQRTALVAQLRLARTVGKPVLLHCREAHADLLEPARRRTWPRAAGSSTASPATSPSRAGVSISGSSSRSRGR